MFSTKTIASLLFIFIAIQSVSFPAYGHEEPEHYTTREEKRESLHPFRISDFVSLSLAIETAQTYHRDSFDNHSHTSEGDFSNLLDLEINVNYSDSLVSKFILEYENDNGTETSSIDEATITFSGNNTEIELGKTYLPLGQFFSHFITDPSVIFAETQTKAITLSYEPEEEVEFDLFTYQSGQHLGWGVATEFAPKKPLKIGLGYISNLDEAGGISVDSDNVIKKVGGLGIYSSLTMKHFDLSAEYITALGSFEELDEDRNKPRAWNIEMSHALLNNIDWSVRVAGSREVDGEPQQQKGIAVIWHPTHQATLTLEYLKNHYSSGFEVNHSGQSLNRSNLVSSRLSILF